MAFLRLPKDSRFSNKEILLFMLPILLEQILIASMPLADTAMISMIPNSNLALAGIANISRLDTFVKQVFVALAAGGSIFVSQYIGAKKYKMANKVLKLSVTSMFLISLVLMVILEAFKEPLLNFLYGSVELGVMTQSLIYYTSTICAYPFMALYNCGSASFRALGKSRMSLYSSAVLLVTNLTLKYIFVIKLDMGVLGAGLSLLIAYAVSGIWLILMLCNKKNVAYIDKIYKPEWDFKQLLKIYKVALPTGIENGMFQLGALILQSLVASLGTVAINANHLTNTLAACTYTFATSFTLGIIPFVGRCMGAGAPDEAEMYIKHILKLDHLVVFIAAAIVVPLTPVMVGLFGMDEEVSIQACNALRLYHICSPLFYPESFGLTNALRGAGDTKFPLIVSTCTMFAFRIGVAYLLILGFDFGMIGIWIAMVMDWVVRATIFTIRFKRGKWKERKLVS